MRPPAPGSVLTTISANSASVASRPETFTVSWKSCPAGTGGAPTWPAATSWFCERMALMTSAGVSPRACSCSGSSQIRIEYSPMPKRRTWPTPGRRESPSTRLMVA